MSASKESTGKVQARELVLDILTELNREDKKSHILLKEVLDKYDYLPDRDKAFIKRVTDGTVEYRIWLDYVIDIFSKTPTAKMRPVIRELLRMSVYQIAFMDRVPDSAVCNEAVKLAVKKGYAGLKGFVNGVLRAVSRGIDTVALPDMNDPDKAVQAMSIIYSCPEHITNMLCREYGMDKTKEMLKASLDDDRGVYIRIDEGAGDEAVRRIAGELADIAVNGSDSGNGDKIPEYALKTLHADKVTRMSQFIEGQITIQDLSSMYVCELAHFEEYTGRKLKVLDMCAAPGGKSLHAASKLRRYGIDGEIISRDISLSKTELIDDGIRRMHCERLIHTEVYDATVYDKDSAGLYDMVLADIPCSGLGVIGRKPDIKYNLSENDLKDIVILQRQILDNAVKYVRPGGRLLLSTCTMRRAENEDNRDHILKTGEYTLRDELKLALDRDHDGFYIAVFDRQG